MRLIVKFGLTKANIRSTLHTAFIYGPQSLGGIGLFYTFVIQRSGRISFLFKQFWKLTPYMPLLHANISTLQLEAGRGGIVFKKKSRNSTMVIDRVLDIRGMEIHIRQSYSHIPPRNRCINTVHARYLPHVTPIIKWRLHHFINTGHKLLPHICNHQGTNFQQSAIDTDTTSNLIYDFNCPRENHTRIAAWGMWRK